MFSNRGDINFLKCFKKGKPRLSNVPGISGTVQYEGGKYKKLTSRAFWKLQIRDIFQRQKSLKTIGIWKLQIGKGFLDISIILNNSTVKLFPKFLLGT